MGEEGRLLRVILDSGSIFVRGHSFGPDATGQFMEIWQSVPRVHGPTMHNVKMASFPLRSLIGVMDEKEYQVSIEKKEVELEPVGD